MIPYDQYHTPSTMSHRMSSSLDDTIPMDKGTSKLELSDSNRTSMVQTCHFLQKINPAIRQLKFCMK